MEKEDQFDLPSSHWPHSPLHKIDTEGTYMVTACTYQKLHYFKSKDRLSFLQKTLITEAARYNWMLQAWAVFSNHYHFVAQSPKNPESLKSFILSLHSKTAIQLNAEDKTPYRKIWHQYWDTKLTNQKSYMARLSYVHRNAVKHKLVENPKEYPWCSAGWFENTSSKAFVGTVYRFTSDSLIEYDEF